ncbi:MAG: hypothetical protein ACREH8_12635 [Opitutaceae bacterium]
MTTVSSSSPDNPPAGAGIETEPLRSTDSSMPFGGSRQPFAVFKETNPSSGAWRVRIKSRQDTTAVLYPNAIRLQARAVSEQGRSTFTWSNSREGRPTDARNLRVVVHVNHGEPDAIEILPPMANAYAIATAAPMKFRWPTV